ncbi:glycosyltransferase family 2 protein [Tardiphaga sp. 866_E4_N2_1]|uniref:glycosyltransferase family 2 protein n=1 Tax=unclassified Tardiphaga TaxID=2631404 RepID=UPI003F27F951
METGTEPVAVEKTSFKTYFSDPELVDRFEAEPDLAVDVIIPIMHTNELWRANLLSAYREIPIRRLLLGNAGCIDNSLEIAMQFPRVTVLDHCQLTSLGFSLRKLIEEVQTEWFVYLHSDVYLPGGWFDTMCGAKQKYDWFESGQNTVIMVKTVAPTLEVERAYSGSQMGRKAAFDRILPTIDDDYLYRNEDIILANLIKSAGFRYGKVESTFVDHQQVFKESPWQRRVKRVNFELELSAAEEIRSAMTYVKGIIKYLKPEQSEDLVPGLQENIDRLVELGALSPGEFAHWVELNHPAWSNIFPPARSYGCAVSAAKDTCSVPKDARIVPGRVQWKRPKAPLVERMRWAPSALFRKTSRLFDRIATRLAPVGRIRER